MNVAIIPARGGSKRIPQKNIKYFFGKPIIAYSIETAILSNLFDKVVVSTDDGKIAEIAKQYGAAVPFKRPVELANGYTGTDEVFIHSLNFLEDENEIYEYACCIYPTTPLLRVFSLIDGLKKLKKNNATSCFPVLEFCSPINRAFKINDRDRLNMIFPKNKEVRTQDLQKTYYDAGQFYWVNVKKFLNEKSVFSRDSVPIVLPKYDVVDIDTNADWIFAESLYKMRKNNQNE